MLVKKGPAIEETHFTALYTTTLLLQTGATRTRLTSAFMQAAAQLASAAERCNLVHLSRCGANMH